MRKILSVVLLLILSLTLLVGCNGDTAPSNEEADGAKTLMTVGEINISLAEYNFTYKTYVQDFCSSYQGYLSLFGLDTSVSLKEQTCNMSETKQTWAEFFMDQTEELLTQVYTFYNAATAAGMTLSKDGQLQVDSFMLSVKEAADKEKKTSDEYLESLFGDGFTAEVYRDIVSRRMLATQYCDEMLAAIEYSDADYEAYYQANKDTIDRINIRIYTVTEDYLPEGHDAETEGTTDAAVKAYAELFAKDLTTEEEFCERAVSFAPASEKANYEGKNSTLVANVSPDKLADGDMKTWLFDQSRKAGDVSVHKTSTAAYTVCYFVSRQRDEHPMVSMRHILLKVDATKEEKSDAKVAAAIQKMYDDWKAAGAKEEEFITLAKANTEDPGSKDNGGLYDFFTRGTMVSEIEDWLYAEGRVMGDTAIIKTSHGYHIVMFKGYGEIGWKYASFPGMQDEDYYKLIEDLSKNYAVSYAENHRDTAGNIKLFD